MELEIGRLKMDHSTYDLQGRRVTVDSRRRFLPHNQLIIGEGKIKLLK
ncbi:MAG: hypothetical protein J6Z14_02145 [Prevotella sp.]|nr:hypothetical protein [Prevotella sp.]